MPMCFFYALYAENEWKCDTTMIECECYVFLTHLFFKFNFYTFLPLEGFCTPLLVFSKLLLLLLLLLLKIIRFNISLIRPQLSYTMNDWCSVPDMVGIFLFTLASTLAPTNHPVQWIPGIISLEVKCPGCETNNLPKSDTWMHRNRSPLPLMSSLYGA